MLQANLTRVSLKSSSGKILSKISSKPWSVHKFLQYELSQQPKNNNYKGKKPIVNGNSGYGSSSIGLTRFLMLNL